MQFKLTQFMVTAIFASAAMVQAYPARTVSAREDWASPDVSSVTTDATSTTSAEGAGAAAGASDTIHDTPVGVFTPLDPNSDTPLGGIASVWNAAKRGGKGGAITEANGDCFNVAADWNDSIASIDVQIGIVCSFHVVAKCSGPAITIRGGSISDLGDGTFDKSISSYYCYPSPGDLIEVLDLDLGTETVLPSP